MPGMMYKLVLPVLGRAGDLQSPGVQWPPNLACTSSRPMIDSVSKHKLVLQTDTWLTSDFPHMHAHAYTHTGKGVKDANELMLLF